MVEQLSQESRSFLGCATTPLGWLRFPSGFVVRLLGMGMKTMDVAESGCSFFDYGTDKDQSLNVLHRRLTD